jgi:UDP-N-acetylglucosamine enolpyruvyl transferase
LKALEELGASISVENGYIYAKTDGLIGANIHFDQVTVTEDQQGVYQ